MKKVIALSSIVLIMSSCVSATPVMQHRDRKVVTVVSVPARPVPPKHPKKVRTRKIVIGTRVSKLPSHRIVVYCNNVPFYYAEGVFYKQVSPSSYEIVKPEIGTIVPQLPDLNVEKVRVGEEDLLLFDGTLYKQIPTAEGIAYKVTGFIEK